MVDSGFLAASLASVAAELAPEAALSSRALSTTSSTATAAAVAAGSALVPTMAAAAAAAAAVVSGLPAAAGSSLTAPSVFSVESMDLRLPSLSFCRLLVFLFARSSLRSSLYLLRSVQNEKSKSKNSVRFSGKQIQYVGVRHCTVSIRTGRDERCRA